jgi:hypothetical protein
MFACLEPVEAHDLRLPISENDGMLTKRTATIADLDQLVDLHMRSFDPEEFSMKLGEPFVRRFYQQAVTSDDTRITVGTGADDRIFCYSIGFTAYRAFQSRMKKAMLLPLGLHILTRLARGRIREAFSIVAYAVEKTATIPGDTVDYHIGLIALDKARGKTPAHVRFFYRLFADTVQFVKSKSGGRCWSSIFADNLTSMRIAKDVMKPEGTFVFRSLPKPTVGLICTGKSAVTAD